MKPFSTLDLINAQRWSRSLFTSYALSLSFFESVVLDALVRQEVGSTAILADVAGVRSALSEYGARSAGRLYDIEPVSVKNGCFHAKVTVLTSKTEAHVVIGSGNLTFGGWGSNLECIEHLHTGFASDSIEDVADFLESLATSPNVALADPGLCFSVAEELRGRAANRPRTGRVRVIHSLNRSILDQIYDQVSDLGGAERLAVASPFYDGSAVEEICKRFNLDRVCIHAHDGGTVAGSAGLAWPCACQKQLLPVAVEWCREPVPRLLHAKVFEVVCRGGRIVLSGSANATMAAWGEGRNVELCVLRRYDTKVEQWQLSPAVALVPAKVDASDGAEDSHEVEGILRAALSSGEVDAQILTPFHAGQARIFRLSAAGQTEIATTIIGSDGHFGFKAREVENLAWSAERLIIRIMSDSGASAQGFVLFRDLAEVRKHLGNAVPSFLSLLAGNETPDDVAAVMTWFYENPSYLTSRPAFAVGDPPQVEAPEVRVDVARILEPTLPSSPFAHASYSSGGAAWRHFMQSVLQCFREPRGPIKGIVSGGNGTSEDDEDNDPIDPTPPEKNNESRLKRFEQLFSAMLNASESRRNLPEAFYIIQFVCDRLEPEEWRVWEYLNRLVDCFIKYPPKGANSEVAAVAVLLWAAGLNEQSDISVARVVRGKLLRLGTDMSLGLPNVSLAKGFTRLLLPEFGFHVLWQNILSVHTPQEEIQTYVSAAFWPLSDADYPCLSRTPEWEALKVARNKRVRIMAQYSAICPFCYMTLPTSKASDLQQNGITNCCGHILLCEQP